MNRIFETVKEELLSGFASAVGETMLNVCDVEANADGIICRYAACGGVKMNITARLGEGSVVLYLEAECESGFAPQSAITMDLGPMKPDALLGSHHDGPWWMYPAFVSDYSELLPKTQSLFIKKGNTSYHLLPLCGDNFRCEFEAGKLRISSDKSGLTRLSGEFLAITEDADPFVAVDKNFKFARSVGAVRVPLINEREYSEIFDGFGWCSWDAFYDEVSSEGIYKKLDEFKAKGIDVSFIIIDDGWLRTTGRASAQRLTGFEINDQFPEGLKATVDKIKNEYGVKYVGVWHAFHGYWGGVEHGCAIAEECADLLEFMKVPVGKPPYLVPSLDPDKGELFWNKWHSYLKDCGIDFVKVDNQSSSTRFYGEIMPTAEACRRAHEAIERSIYKYFDGVVINCMGMDMENVLARPKSGVSRNSDDFYPNRERSFIKHLTQNAYNAIWHSRMYYCDFDMWWSGLPESAVQSGVLRAISGSPVYVSDKVGESVAENILPIMEDGRILRCDYAARPTYDCFWSDCCRDGKHLKIWNRSGEYFALAAFNVGDGEITDRVDFGAIPEVPDGSEYMAYEYFSKTFTRVNKETSVPVTLVRDGCAVWSLYPIMNDGDGEYIMLGDLSKYVPIASKKKVRTKLSELA